MACYGLASAGHREHAAKANNPGPSIAVMDRAMQRQFFMPSTCFAIGLISADSASHMVCRRQDGLGRPVGVLAGLAYPTGRGFPLAFAAPQICPW